jgi:molybdopterin-synthase adenylyltransferase
MERGLKRLNQMFSASITSANLKGTGIPGALDRHQRIIGFDQGVFSRSHVVCIGAGGLMSNIAPALVRKGIGSLTLVDPDEVEITNLNRQRFYVSDIGQNKAIALAKNLRKECTAATLLIGYAISFQTACWRRLNLLCNIAICGVDNNCTRVAAARYFRDHGIPVVFAAVSADADHGYVFVQHPGGSCIGCVFPDIVDDETFPCPGTPAISDVLQLVGAFVTYAVDSVLMGRKVDWNYRSIALSSASGDAASVVGIREGCRVCTHN